MIKLPDDDPDALEVVLKYLYTLSTDCIFSDECPLNHGKLLNGFPCFLLQVFQLAEKHSLDLLAEHIADYVTHPIRCRSCQILATPTDVLPTKENESPTPEGCIDLRDYPLELIQALALSEDIGNSKLAVYIRARLYAQVTELTLCWKNWIGDEELRQDPSLKSESDEVTEVIAQKPSMGLNLVGLMAHRILHLEESRSKVRAKLQATTDELARRSCGPNNARPSINAR